MARCTSCPANLRISSHFNDHVIKSPAKVLDGSMAILEPLQIGIQPGSDMIDSQVNHPFNVGRKFGHPLRVANGLARHEFHPGLS